MAVLVLLAVGWYTSGLDWLAERQWEAYVAEARARGVKFTVEEIKPPRVPESDDLLQTVVFRDAELGNPYSKLLDRNLVIRRPDSPDGRLMLPDWAETRTNLRGVADDPSESDDVRAARGAMAEFQPMLEELFRIRTRSGNWDDLWVTSRAGVASHHRVLGGMRLLTFKAEADLASGEVPGARTSFDAYMRLAKCLESAPGLDGEFFRQWGDREFRNVLFSGLEMQVWRDEDLRAFVEFSTQQNVLERYRWALESGRAQWAEICEKNLGGHFAQKKRWNDLGYWQLRVRSARKRWWRTNGEWLQRFFDEEMVGYDATRGTWSVPQPRKYDISKIDSTDANFGLVNTTRGFLEELLPGTLFTHAMNKMAGIACALELHRRKRGDYPEQLAELTPEFLTILPNDTCGGQPFRYRRVENEGYLLYSIGLNERDDGGAIGGETRHPDWRWWAPRK